MLDIGSGSGSDKQGRYYRDYFPNAASYTTSEVSEESGVDLVLDVRDMPTIADATYDAVFCSGVLEHVDDLLQDTPQLAVVIDPLEQHVQRPCDRDKADKFYSGKKKQHTLKS